MDINKKWSSRKKKKRIGFDMIQLTIRLQLSKWINSEAFEIDINSNLTLHWNDHDNQSKKGVAGRCIMNISGDPSFRHKIIPNWRHRKFNQNKFLAIISPFPRKHSFVNFLDIECSLGFINVGRLYRDELLRQGMMSRMALLWSRKSFANMWWIEGVGRNQIKAKVAKSFQQSSTCRSLPNFPCHPPNRIKFNL